MSMPKIQTVKKVVPMCYAYTTPGVVYHDGWTKIGYTEKDVDTRIKQQTQTANIIYHKEWAEEARYTDGSGDTFTDKEFHTYLAKNDIKRKDPEPDDEGCPEWFYISGEESQKLFWRFKADKGIMESLNEAIPYVLRKEQDDAVIKTINYFNKITKNPEFLWNAKPRFGKTLSAYDLCKRMNFQKILIVTNRPAIATSWYNDYEQFLGTKSGYYFISNVTELKNKKYVISREDYINKLDDKDNKGCIEFVSLQDLKGSKKFGGQYDKLNEVADLTWDILIIDEAHEGVDTFKTDVAFDHITRRCTLHLSGTPFKALANGKFTGEAIYNWTYADEQRAKRDWDKSSEYENPYENLPKLNLLTYRLSDIVLDKLKKGADFDGDGDNEAFAFDLNEFFKTDENGQFVLNNEVDKFLDALTTQSKFPFSTKELRDELKHTLWILKYVSSAKALVKKLEEHPLFKNYKIILAAGDGKITDDGTISDDEMDKTIKKSYDKVKKAIENYEKTITISVGQLTTGITIPEWTGVMMLSNMQSPSLYMQAAFRSQNPCLFNVGGEPYRKENAYVFDFDPARTLTIFDQFANDLIDTTINGRGDIDTRKDHIRELLNFFPVYGEDENGQMIELDAEKVLTIPRIIHAKEVVRCGFMSNFLFQNITGIFSAPSVVKDIVDKLTPSKEPIKVDINTERDLSLNKYGNIDISNEIIEEKVSDLFGPKIYSDIENEITNVIYKSRDEESIKQSTIDNLKSVVHNSLTGELASKAKETYGQDMTKSVEKNITSEINKEADKFIEKHYGDYSIKKTLIEDERKKEIKKALDDGRNSEIENINKNYDLRQKENNELLENNLISEIHSIIEDAETNIVKAVETDKKRKEKEEIENSVRDHLRGFSRTIPSFLMAYGTTDTTLQNFDSIIPDNVFLDVTGITIDDFRFLRDGGEYPDPEDASKTKHFNGNLFEPIIFNDSIQEFLNKRDELANYFDANSKEDIFDYIPPQRTNQIYTPKKVVKEMVDQLEQENPNCFSNPQHTFIDLYMKSGLYITEIVKRLFQNNNMKDIYPDENERLKHIFEKQVFGLAPTEIIYAISTHYILGFSKNKNIKINSNNFKLFDATQSAVNGTLEEDLNKLFENKQSAIFTYEKHTFEN